MSPREQAGDAGGTETMSTAVGTVRRPTPWGWLLLALVTGAAFVFAIWALFGGGIRLPVAAPTADEPGATAHTLSVTGTGRVLVTPDLAEVRLGVVVQAPTVAEARNTGARAMNGALTAIRAAGIADKDLQTSTLSLSPVYESKPEGGTPHIVAYELRNGLTVTIRDLAKIGPVIDGAIAGGASTVESVTFSVAEPGPLERQAREAAVADARAKADTLVRAAGTSITGVVSITESVATPPWTWRDGMAASPGGTPILPGTTEISVSVSMVYGLD